MQQGSYIVHEGQSVFDIALHAYGSIEAVFWLLEDNPGLSLISNLISGDELVLRDLYFSKQVYDYYQKNSIVPVSKPEAWQPLFGGDFDESDFNGDLH